MGCSGQGLHFALSCSETSLSQPLQVLQNELAFVRKMGVQKGKAVKEGQKEESSEDGQSEEYIIRGDKDERKKTRAPGDVGTLRHMIISA